MLQVRKPWPQCIHSAAWALPWHFKAEARDRYYRFEALS